MEDSAMAVSFGTNGAGSFRLGSSLGSRGGSPLSLGGFFAHHIKTDDSGYCSKDTGPSDSDGSTASKPQPIMRPGEAGSNPGSYGTSPAQRYKADVRQRSNSTHGGSLAGSPRQQQAGSLGLLDPSLSPDLLASLEDPPFGMEMDMDMDV